MININRLSYYIISWLIAGGGGVKEVILWLLLMAPPINTLFFYFYISVSVSLQTVICGRTDIYTS